MKQIRDIEHAFFLDDAYWQHVDRKHRRQQRLRNRVANYRGRRLDKSSRLARYQIQEQETDE